jgi:Lon protease-like protein
MTGSTFDPPFEALPATLPIFPLNGVLLLPRGRLPLNIFEPRYLAMTRDAMGAERMIGMIQPSDPNDPGDNPPVYRTGCAGRITSFSETEDGRFLITLTGIARFDIREELPLRSGYRRVVADWEPYRGDIAPDDGAIDRERLLAVLRVFFKVHGISADWDTIKQTPDERLVTSLAMICPFAANEKQALLEAGNLEERAEVMIALIEMAVIEGAKDGEGSRH